MSVVSHRAAAAGAAFDAVGRFYFASRYSERRFAPTISDFTFGNPQEMPLPGIGDAIRRHAVPRDKNWFAYKTSEPEPQAFLAGRLSTELGLPFAPADIALTAGAFAAIALAFRVVVDAGDEIVFSAPGWFCYEPIALAADAVPKKIALEAPAFDLDLAAIEAAITPRTRLVIVNTPHNPTGRIVPRETLAGLADLLDRASRRIGRQVFLLADEPYRRLRFDGRGFTSPAALYPYTLIAYSYGKVLLAPGQRLGYLAISPLMPEPDRKALQDAMFPAQMALGWTFPNAVMQYALPDLEDLSIDLAALTRRRDAAGGHARRRGLRNRPAGGHVLPLGPLARGRGGRAHLERARRPRRLRAARRNPRHAQLVPHLPHRIRRHGRTRAPGLRRGREALTAAPTLCSRGGILSVEPGGSLVGERIHHAGGGLGVDLERLGHDFDQPRTRPTTGLDHALYVLAIRECTHRADLLHSYAALPSENGQRQASVPTITAERESNLAPLARGAHRYPRPSLVPERYCFSHCSLISASWRSDISASRT